MPLSPINGASANEVNETAVEEVSLTNETLVEVNTREQNSTEAWKEEDRDHALDRAIEHTLGYWRVRSPLR